MMSLHDLPAMRRRKGERTVRRALTASRRKVDELPVAEWGDGELAALRDEEPRPSFTPAPPADTGEIPVLSDAQAVFGDSAPQWAEATPEVLARLRTALKGQHPFDASARTETQRVREDTPAPRIHPLPREIPMASPQVRERRAEAAEARLDTLTYPACDGSATGADYAELLRRVGRITGTTTRFEQPGAWAQAIATGAAA